MEKPGDVLQEKQEVVARVIEVNPEQRRMRLSISALEERPESERQPRHGGEESRKKKEDRREERQQQKAALDEVPQYNPFADAFKSQEFSE